MGALSRDQKKRIETQEETTRNIHPQLSTGGVNKDQQQPQPSQASLSFENNHSKKKENEDYQENGGIEQANNRYLPFAIKSAETYAQDTNTPIVKSKRYFRHSTLPAIVYSYPVSKRSTYENIRREKDCRKVMLHFVLLLLELNPFRRLSAGQALQHPFITGPQLECDLNIKDLLNIENSPLLSGENIHPPSTTKIGRAHV